MTGQPSPTMSGACSAIRDMAKLVAERHCPVVIMHNRDQRRCRYRHHGRISPSFFARSLEIAAKAGISRRTYRARSRHRLWQDPGAEHDGAGPPRRIRHASACRCWSARRASASSATMIAVRAASAARRLDRGASDRGEGRRADHPDPRCGGNRTGACAWPQRFEDSE